MPLLLKSFIGLIAASLLLLNTGCNKDKGPENLRIPRLMLEQRGIEYGNLGGGRLILPISGTQIQVTKEVLITEFEFTNVELVKVDMGMALLLELTELGARKLYRASVTNNGNRIVLTINDNAVGARRLDGAIQDGKFYTFVELPAEDLGQLVLDMKATLAELQRK